jgi:hypothetical protein
VNTLPRWLDFTISHSPSQSQVLLMITDFLVLIMTLSILHIKLGAGKYWSMSILRIFTPVNSTTNKAHTKPFMDKKKYCRSLILTHPRSELQPNLSFSAFYSCIGGCADVGPPSCAIGAPPYRWRIPPPPTASCRSSMICSTGNNLNRHASSAPSLRGSR